MKMLERNRQITSHETFDWRKIEISLLSENKRIKILSEPVQNGFEKRANDYSGTEESIFYSVEGSILYRHLINSDVIDTRPRNWKLSAGVVFYELTAKCNFCRH